MPPTPTPPFSEQSSGNRVVFAIPDPEATPTKEQVAAAQKRAELYKKQRMLGVNFALTTIRLVSIGATTLLWNAYGRKVFGIERKVSFGGAVAIASLVSSLGQSFERGRIIAQRTRAMAHVYRTGIREGATNEQIGEVAKKVLD